MCNYGCYEQRKYLIPDPPYLLAIPNFENWPLGLLVEVLLYFLLMFNNSEIFLFILLDKLLALGAPSVMEVMCWCFLLCPSSFMLLTYLPFTLTTNSANLDATVYVMVMTLVETKVF